MSTILIILLSVGIVWFARDLFEKGKELNKMVISFAKLHLMLNELADKIEGTIDADEHKEELLVTAYLFRREIIFRLNRYKWSMNTPLLIPGISSNRIVLLTIFQQTINKILSLSRKIDLEDTAQEIMDGKEAYFELDKALPNYIKDRI